MSRAKEIVAAFVVLLVLVLPRTARAERDLIVPFHEGGRLVLDQLAGVRASAASGLSYAGPIGVAFQTTSAGDAQAKTTRLWLAPSADVFVTEHLSLGGIVDVSYAFGSTKASGQEVSLPGTTSITVVPRVGFYVPLGDRFGVWPRLGVGYARVEGASVQAGAPVRETFQSLLLEGDLSLVYRFDETFFLRAGPSISVSVGGRREVEGGVAGVDGSVLAVTGAMAFGVNLDP